jgi:preprotein translocase subunit YajC
VSNWVEFLPLLLLVVIFWFLVVRPARARQQDFLRTQSALSVGNQVMLASGIFGEIASIGDETIELRVAPDTVITVNRQAVARVVEAPAELPDAGTGSDD